MDPMPFANFIVTRMLKPLPEHALAQRAASETPVAMGGDEWYWADDNAKVLELLSLPGVWRAHPEAATDLIRFVNSMCDGPLIFRRISAPRLEINESDGKVGKITHSMMNITCNLQVGEVGLGMRFHDSRTARNVLFGGNYIRLKMGGRTYTVDAEEGIFHTAIDPIEGGVRLTWVSHIVASSGVFRKEAVPVGDLTYTCTITAASMFVDFDVHFDPLPGVGLSDVVLTFGCDQLSHNDNDIRYELASAVSVGDESVQRKAAKRSSMDIALDGIRYWSVIQMSHMPGFAAGMHSLPADPSRVKHIKGMGNRYARLQWMVSEHAFDGPCGSRISASERKIITAGGFYQETKLYADTLRRQSDISDAGSPPIDLSISYDYGAEINALARCLSALSAPEPPMAGELSETLRKEVSQAFQTLMAAYDRFFIKPAHHELTTVFSRSLAYVAFAQAELFKITGDSAHTEALREICDLIARFERINTGVDGTLQSGFLMGTAIDAIPYVDCHAPCMTALIRGCEVLNTPEYAPAIERGLAAFCLDTQGMDGYKIDVVCVDFVDGNGVKSRPETYWNFKAGLCLQLFNALRSTSSPAVQAVWAKHKDRIELLEGWMRGRVDRSMRHHHDGIEILTSVRAGETNSETQPWVALGLMG